MDMRIMRARAAPCLGTSIESHCSKRTGDSMAFGNFLSHRFKYLQVSVRAHRLGGVFVSGTVMAGTGYHRAMTDDEREAVLRVLDESAGLIEQSVAGVPEVRWILSPGDGQWSPAEVLEHVILTEESVSRNVMCGLPNGTSSRSVQRSAAPVSHAARSPAASSRAKASPIAAAGGCERQCGGLSRATLPPS